MQSSWWEKETKALNQMGAVASAVMVHTQLLLHHCSLPIIVRVIPPDFQPHIKPNERLLSQDISPIMSVSKTYCTAFGIHPVPANTTLEDFQAKCEALVESFVALPVAQQNFLKFDIVYPTLLLSTLAALTSRTVVPE